MTKKALITGITGQDGAFLAKYLLNRGYEIFGTYRRLSTPNFWRLQYLDIFEKINLVPADLVDMGSILEAIKISEPDEIYHLAAQSFVGTAFEQPIGTGDMTGLGVIRILEAVRQLCPDTKFYNASTSELFGTGHSSSLNEHSPFQPASPYAVAKLYGYWLTRQYREGYNIFTCNGILFNHESELRGLEFVTRKISNAVAKIALGIEKELKLGNLEAKRDWGYAPEYCKSMFLMLQYRPNDYVIATNESHSVKEFAERAFDVVGLDWQEYVKTDKRFFRPIDVEFLQGDYTKARKKLGWAPEVKFDELVKIMVREDLSRWERWLNGERFAWDAPNYPNEAKIITRSLRV
ncbi:MAG: GDP-mannose 4,6-dehydratase [Thermoplasmatales archaeon]|nr:GDP-mannose 4,6-dehydratase [Thermoplasmatales archaeon]